MQDVILAGATGLIGKNLLSFLLRSPDYEKVHILVRQNISLQHEKLIVHLVDFENPEPTLSQLSAETFFCCIGTTMRQAGSTEAFRKVDYEYPLRLGQIVKRQGIKQFVLISSIGANKNSRIFYSRVKGEVEEALTDLKFGSTLIFRPSLLLGHRQEFRFAEEVSKIFMKIFIPFFIGSIRRYRPVQATSVAAVMAYEAARGLKGISIYESDHIQLISEGLKNHHD
jgi:uncharacterized protein YbjT (DUF2867 family)